MITGIFYNGSGIGNQLHRYVATRVLALDKGYDFGMFYVDDGSGKVPSFKGQSFMSIDWGVPKNHTMKNWHEKKIVENGVDIRGYDPEFNFIEDNTIIDGEFQDERYFKHRMKEIDEWLKVEPIHTLSGESFTEDVCVIGFRGGEYSVFPDLFLPKEYWEEGIRRIKAIKPNLTFEVHTDDEVLARQFFPDLKIIHDIGINWRSVRYAKYAIIANSSFFIFPRLLQHFNNKDAVTIAPRYWARHNTKVWALPQNYYKDFCYI